MKNPLFPISIAFLIGILVASFLMGYTSLIVNTASILALITITLFLIFFKIRTISHISLFILIFLTGFIRFSAFNELPKNHIKYVVTEEPRIMVLKGTICSNPVFKRKYGYYPELEFLLKVKAIGRSRLSMTYMDRAQWINTNGLVLIKAYYGGTKTFEYGDKIVLEGEITMPRTNKAPGEFNYRGYLARRKIYAVCKIKKNGFIEKSGRLKQPLPRIKRFLYSIKNKATRNILINLSPPHSSILAAMLLGNRQYLDKPIKDIFIKTGTMHIIAISGLHVGILVFIFLGLFKLIKIPKRIAYIFTIALIILYALMVGQRPSVWRASIMASVLLLGFVLNKQGQILNTLSLALLILIIPNPNYIFDAGFILSFLCIASIIWISPVIDKLFKPIAKGPKTLLYILKSFSISISVWIGIMPIIAYYFHIITPVTILANLVAIPICFVLVSLGIEALLFGLFLPGISIFFYETVWLTNKAMLLSLEFLSALPGAFIEIENIPLFCIFIYYAILVFIIVFYIRPRRGNS